MTETPNTIIFGVDSFLGSEFFSSYKKESNVIGTSLKGKETGVQKFDFRTSNISVLKLRKKKINDALILGGKTNISWCENNKKQASGINVESTIHLIKQLAEKGIKVVFFSSDYVFDGKKGKYTESDSCNPSTHYGKCKYEVEKQLPKITNGNYIIIRLGKVFSKSSRDKTLLQEFITKVSQNEVLQVNTEQVFSPICVEDVVKFTKKLQEINAKGIYHLSSGESWTYEKVARKIVHGLKKSDHKIKTTFLENIYPDQNRPKDTTLSNEKILRECNVHFQNMSSYIDEAILEFTKK